MDRLRTRSLWVGAFFAAFVLATAGGCSILPFIAYLYEGLATPAEYDGLKGKRVAVICRPVASLQYQSRACPRTVDGRGLPAGRKCQAYQAHRPG